MALSRSLHHISYHDSGLRGVAGANEVLRAISYNPFATRFTLSHNELGDDGLIRLCSGILELRRHGRMLAPLRELNLSSNGITDVGLDAIIKYILLPSAPPNSILPTIHELILSNNQISLSGSTSHLLSMALSHPSSTLVSLSLTSNPRISHSPSHLRGLLQHLEPTSLIQLQLNACNLQREDARTIARWLSIPGQGGRLVHLELNANSLGTDRCGTNRIAKVVYAGLNTSLIRLELASNERQVILEDDGDFLMVDQLAISSPPASSAAVSGRASGASTPPQAASKQSKEETEEEEEEDVIEGDDLSFAEQVRPILSAALARNHILREATRHAALNLLPRARVLMHARRPRDLTASQIKRQVLVDGGVQNPDHSGDHVATSSSQTIPIASASKLRSSATTTNSYTYTTSPTPPFHSTTSSASLSSSSPIPNGNAKNLSPLETNNEQSPILKLPPELLLHILRCYTALEPVPLPPDPRRAKTYDPSLTTMTTATPNSNSSSGRQVASSSSSSSSSSSTTTIFASPLTENQMMRILTLAQDRMTLSGMTHRFDTRSYQSSRGGFGGGGGGGMKRDSRDSGRVSLHDSASCLRVVGCLEYERQRIR